MQRIPYPDQKNSDQRSSTGQSCTGNMALCLKGARGNHEIGCQQELADFLNILQRRKYLVNTFKVFLIVLGIFISTQGTYKLYTEVFHPVATFKANFLI